MTGYLEHKSNLAEFLKNVTMTDGLFVLAAVGSGSIALFSGESPGLLVRLP